MKKSLIISEADNIAALLENDRVVEFFVNRGELLLGDVYVAIVENILPGIDAAFVNLGKDKMGFLHANDIPGEGPLRERLVPKQKLLVQITKEPTGHKGPRVSTAISLPGRFLVLVPEERGISISRRISEAKERARLKSVVTLMKPPGVGVIIRTEAKGQSDQSLFEDFEALWDRWQTIVSEGEASIGPKLVYRDQDLLYRVIRDAYSTDVSEIICDTADGQRRAADFMSGWAGRATKVVQHSGEEPLLVSKGIDKEIESVLLDRAELPSGGHLNIQPTEALTVIDVNSGRFTSSRTQAETVRRTNIEAAQEIPRQLRLRNIGGMVIVDFIDMESRRDQQQVLEVFNRSLEDDRAKPQVGQMSDLGLVELTRRRQGQSLRELFATQCPHCTGAGVVPTVALSSSTERKAAPAGLEEEAAVGAGKIRPLKRPVPGKAQPLLRAATATGGRIQQTVHDFEPAAEDDDEESAEVEAVPLDILEQMPEDLLEPAQTAPAARASKFGLDEGEDEDTDEMDGPSFERDPEEEAAVIATPIARAPEFEEAEEEAAIEVETSEPDEVVEVTARQTEVAPAPPPPEPAPLPESDFETEVDPVTGIFRLKPKVKEEKHQTAYEQDQSQGREEEVFSNQFAAQQDDTVHSLLDEDEPEMREPYFQDTSNVYTSPTETSAAVDTSETEDEEQRQLYQHSNPAPYPMLGEPDADAPADEADRTAATSSEEEQQRQTTQLEIQLQGWQQRDDQ